MQSGLLFWLIFRNTIIKYSVTLIKLTLKEFQIKNLRIKKKLHELYNH